MLANQLYTGVCIENLLSFAVTVGSDINFIFLPWYLYIVRMLLMLGEEVFTVYEECLNNKRLQL